MAEENKDRPSFRPYYRRDRPPTLPSPSQVPAPSAQSTADQEEETVKYFTPVFCQHELSLDILTKDATTPVLPVQSPLPPHPSSPAVTVQLTTSELGQNLRPAGNPLLQRDSNQKDSRANVFNKRSGSQRLPKGRKAQKKNVGIVIGDFNGMYPDELSTKVGEEIEIISKDTVVSRNIGWWTGRNAKGKIGIFPAACVSCDLQGGSGGGATSSQYPLEIKNSEVAMKEVIGIGGFGKVFRAIYKGEEVAVKVAKATTFDSLKAVQDVIMEAERFAHLAHNNICALVGVVLVKDVCLVMEYAKGGALSEILHKNNIPLSIDVIVNWTAQVASGMHYLHHEVDPSLIHRDLKTSNSK